VDRAGAQAWLDSYVAAWLSYDADDIRALFTEDIAYRYDDGELACMSAALRCACSTNTTPDLWTTDRQSHCRAHRQHAELPPATHGQGGRCKPYRAARMAIR
jgi:hypothetical protein